MSILLLNIEYSAEEILFFPTEITRYPHLKTASHTKGVTTTKYGSIASTTTDVTIIYNLTKHLLATNLTSDPLHSFGSLFAFSFTSSTPIGILLRKG
jgi:hypothetical protein